MHFNLAFIGYGTVGQGLTEILLEKKEMLAEKHDFHCKIVAISDLIKGSVYDENGLDMKKILDLAKEGKKLDEYKVDEETVLVLHERVSEAQRMASRELKEQLAATGLGISSMTRRYFTSPGATPLSPL